MEPQDLLIVSAELGVAIAGFAGVVSVFGARRREEWSFVERFRLESLLTASLTTVALALLGLVLLAADVESSSAWRLSSSAWALSAVFFLSRSYSRLRVALAEGGTVSRPYSAAVYGSLGFAIVLQIWNVVAVGEFWPFFVGLSLGLLCAASFFRRVFLLG